MVTLQLLHSLPLLVLLLIAAGIDARDRRIPNWLTVLLILSGLVQSFFPNHVTGPVGAVAGLFAGGLIPFVMFAIGALGAGDVKLMAGVGAWLGPLPALAVFTGAAVIGMLIVLAQAAVQGRLRVLTQNSLNIGLSLIHIRQLGAGHAARTGHCSRSVDRPLPYAVPVLAGVLMVLLARWR